MYKLCSSLLTLSRNLDRQMCWTNSRRALSRRFSRRRGFAPNSAELCHKIWALRIKFRFCKLTVKTFQSIRYGYSLWERQAICSLSSAGAINQPILWDGEGKGGGGLTEQMKCVSSLTHSCPTLEQLFLLQTSTRFILRKKKLPRSCEREWWSGSKILRVVY